MSSIFHHNFVASENLLMLLRNMPPLPRLLPLLTILMHLHNRLINLSKNCVYETEKNIQNISFIILNKEPSTKFGLHTILSSTNFH